MTIFRAGQSVPFKSAPANADRQYVIKRDTAVNKHPLSHRNATRINNNNATNKPAKPNWVARPLVFREHFVHLPVHRGVDVRIGTC